MRMVLDRTFVCMFSQVLRAILCSTPHDSCISLAIATYRTCMLTSNGLDTWTSCFRSRSL